MAETSNSSNTAIVALLVLIVLIVLGVFLFNTGSKDTRVIEENVTEERVVPGSDSLDINLDNGGSNGRSPGRNGNGS